MSVDVSSESLPTVFLSRENDVTWDFLMSVRILLMIK